jgi:hypothetical protein
LCPCLRTTKKDERERGNIEIPGAQIVSNNDRRCPPSIHRDTAYWWAGGGAGSTKIFLAYTVIKIFENLRHSKWQNYNKDTTNL